MGPKCLLWYYWSFKQSQLTINALFSQQLLLEPLVKQLQLKTRLVNSYTLAAGKIQNRERKKKESKEKKEKKTKKFT